MKILIFSDSHGETTLMSQIIKLYEGQAEHVIFLGDCINDCFELQRAFPHINFFSVPGNCDFHSNQPLEVLLELGKMKFFVTHGHKHGVKRSYDRIVSAALAHKANACFFGHSHIPAQFQKNGIIFLNPGSITEPRGKLGKSYALAEILNGTISAQIHEVGAC
jgi:hypothetical protein